MEHPWFFEARRLYAVVKGYGYSADVVWVHTGVEDEMGVALHSCFPSCVGEVSSLKVSLGVGFLSSEGPTGPLHW